MIACRHGKLTWGTWLKLHVTQPLHKPLSEISTLAAAASLAELLRGLIINTTIVII